MAKTFTSNIASVNTGDVLTSSGYNTVLTTLNSHTVPPMCQMAVTASFSLTTTATNYTLTSSSFPIDTDSMSGTANQITISTAGVYLVSYSISFATNATGYRAATIALNGVGSAVTGTGYAPATLAGSSGSGTVVCNSRLMNLSAGQYLTLVGAQSSGGTLALSSNDQYLQAVFVGRAS
jgi:hypothetical protein